MSKNVSDYLVEMLVETGAKVFTQLRVIVYTPVNDAVQRDGRLQWFILD
jgi:hypothetical protein